MLHDVAHAVYEFVYPPSCLACERFLPESLTRICPECFSSLTPVHAGDALYREMYHRLCGGGPAEGFASAFYFEKGGVLQTLIHDLKYAEMPVVGVELGKHVAVALAALLHEVPDAALVPVPLHPTKLRERGYNQSEYIARGIQMLTGLPVVTNLLRRRRYTESQTQLDREGRRSNVSGAFELKKNARCESGSFLVVDDVITTGATIMECARVLRDHGATHVYVASIALAAYTEEGDV